MKGRNRDTGGAVRMIWLDEEAEYAVDGFTSWAPGDTLEVSAAGDDVGPFAAAVVAPHPIEGLEPNPEGAIPISVSEDWTLRWTPHGSSYMEVIVSSAVAQLKCRERDAGLKRWRVARDVGGYWTNTWRPGDEASWIDDRDFDRIGARPARFEQLLGEVTPEERRDLLLEIIEEKRRHLRTYPASCAAREARERAFEDLYALASAELGMTREQVDAEHRALDDYVFAELDYGASKTCCWNSTTAAMYEIIMDYNRRLQEDGCNEPAVFMARAGGYDLFRDHAAATDRAALWVEWSADEECPQADVYHDTEASHAWTPWCELGATPPPPGASCAEDGAEENDEPASASPLGAGDAFAGAVCGGDDDYFVVTGDGRNLVVTLSFDHDRGDLDLELRSAGGDVLARSNGVSDTETVETDTASGTPYYVRVFGYGGAEGAYTLSAELR